MPKSDGGVVDERWHFEDIVAGYAEESLEVAKAMTVRLALTREDDDREVLAALGRAYEQTR